MQPRVPSGEDTQPNERRLNRKGTTNVPMIRLTTAPRRNGRGTSRGRAGTLYTNRNPQNLSRASRMSNLPQSPSRGRGINIGQQTYSSGLSHHSAASHPTSMTRTVSQNTSKRLSPFPDAQQSKRARLTYTSDTPPEARHDRPSASSPAVKPTRKRKPKSRIKIKLDIPLYCRTGVHGCQMSRRNWVDREIQRIEQERKVKVRGTNFLDREVVLYCSAEQQQDISARRDSAVKREEGPTINPLYVDSRVLCEPSKEGDIQNVDNALSAVVTTSGHEEESTWTTTEHDLSDRTARKAQLAKSSEKPTISWEPKLPLVPQQFIADCSGNRPLAKASYVKRTSNYKLHSANLDNIPLATHGRDSSGSSLGLPSTTHVESFAESTNQHDSHPPHHTLRGFRSGSLLIKPSAGKAAHSVQDVLQKYNVGPQLAKDNSQTAWVDDSDSDTPLASISTPAFRKIRRPTGSAGPKRTDHNIGLPLSSDLTEINSLSSSSSIIQTSPVADVETMQMSIDSHDRTRRILQLSSDSWIHVTMRGIISRVDLLPLRQHSVVHAPATPAREEVDDACVLQAFDNAVAVLGHGRDEQQISLVNLDHNRRQGSYLLDRPWNRAKKGGVSAVCAMMQPLMFASGGQDHVVHLWTAEEDLASASPSQLAIKHNSVVQSLLPIRDTSHKLVSAGADNSVHVWDLSSERVVNTIRTSNSVFHAHPTSSPYCILLEVAHRELQYELRDYRLVPEKPVQRFGYETPHIHGRFIKGDSRLTKFVCGGRDGCIRLWDLRHYRVPSATTTCFPAVKVVQATFEESNSHILVSSARNNIARVKYIVDDV